MTTPVHDERFVIEDERDGWLKLERKAGDAMSIRERELPELIAVLRGFLVRRRPTIA